MKGLKRFVQESLQILDLDIRVRYQPVCAYLKQADPAGKDSLLEIGSGSLGLTRYLKRKMTGLDKEFSGDISPNLSPSCGDATHLPFEDRSFDHVISVDLLEHLSPDARVPALQEILRVARKGGVLVVPCSKESEAAERHLAFLYEKRGKEIPEWLSEHLSNRLPTPAEIVETISAFNKTEDRPFKVNVVSNQSLWMWSFCTRLFLWGTLPFFLTMVLFWFATPLVFPLTCLGRPYRKAFFISK